MVVFFSSRRRHTRLQGDWSSDVCSSDLNKSIRTPFKRRPIDASRVYRCGTCSRIKVRYNANPVVKILNCHMFIPPFLLLCMQFHSLDGFCKFYATTKSVVTHVSYCVLICITLHQ